MMPGSLKPVRATLIIHLLHLAPAPLRIKLEGKERGGIHEGNCRVRHSVRSRAPMKTATISPAQGSATGGLPQLEGYLDRGEAIPGLGPQSILPPYQASSGGSANRRIVSPPGLQTNTYRPLDLGSHLLRQPATASHTPRTDIQFPSPINMFDPHRMSNMMPPLSCSSLTPSQSHTRCSPRFLSQSLHFYRFLLP